jgi:hypothetical protein
MRTNDWSGSVIRIDNPRERVHSIRDLVGHRAVSSALTFGSILIVAALAWLGVGRYGRYTVLEGVPRDSTRIPKGVLDIGVASDGRLLAIIPSADAAPIHALAVHSLDSLGPTRFLFGLLEPAAMKNRGKFAPAELIDAKLAPIAARVAALWQSEEGNYLSTGDGRGADNPIRVDGARQLAISRDGAMLALSRPTAQGFTAQVLRVATAAPETLFTIALGGAVEAMAVSPGGRLAVAEGSSTVRLMNPLGMFKAPGRVSRIAFLGETRLAAVGDFDGVEVLDSLGSTRIVAHGSGNVQGISAEDSNIVVWESGAHLKRYTMRSVRHTRMPVAIGIPIFAYWIASIIGAAYIRANRRRSRQADFRRGSDDVALPVLQLPAPPRALIDACAKGQGVLYAGAGLSAADEYPTWAQFVEELVLWAAKRDLLESSLKDSLLTALSRSQTNSVAYSVVTTLQQKGHGDKLQEFVKETFQPKGFTLPKVHRTLIDVGFAGLLTHNLDTLLERTFAGAKIKVHTPGESEELLNALSQGSLFLLKLYGSVDRPPVLIAPAQYQAAVETNLSFVEFSQQLYVSRTLLFLGTSMSGITDYVESFTLHRTPDIQHFALVAVDEPGWEAKANLLLERYGVRVLPYTPTTDYPEVLAFVSSLAAEVADARQRIDGERVEERKHAGSLKRISLRNVGPFEKLDIDLDPHITVILGDNGLGKSTILRAIGLALAGSDQESDLASGLIRAKHPGRKQAETQDGAGQVTLETQGGKTYTMIISRRGTEGVRTQFQPHSWQRGEGQLALGFPPLRSVSANAVASPKILEEKPRPLPSDVLPIVAHGPDSRVSDLKEWLFSMDYRRRTNPDGTTQRMLRDFFITVNELLEGVSIDFQDLVLEAGEIRVKTEDGNVPLHSLSQGTISMIGLIGVMLPRLYDVHGAGAEPPKGFAIALIDEIDAHMHPLWQQKLVSKLRVLFPAVQFIVTTHSPFIAAGREKTEIVRLRRDDQSRKIVVDMTYADTKGVDVASLLTGHLFGLKAPTDPETEKDLVARRQLVAAETLTEPQKNQLRDLNIKLAGVIAAPTPDAEYNRYLRLLGEREKHVATGRTLTGEEEEETLALARQALDEVRSELRKQ